MKRFFDSISRAFWRLTTPIRRPVSRKIAIHITGSVATALRDEVQPKLDEAILGIRHARTEVGTYRNETNLVLDSLVRELFRLQDQVEVLQHLVVRMSGSRGDLGLSGRDDGQSSSAA